MLRNLHQLTNAGQQRSGVIDQSRKTIPHRTVPDRLFFSVPTASPRPDPMPGTIQISEEHRSEPPRLPASPTKSACIPAELNYHCRNSDQVVRFRHGKQPLSSSLLPLEFPPAPAIPLRRPMPTTPAQEEAAMQYKTIVLELIQERPELHEQLRSTQTAAADDGAYAIELKACTRTGRTSSARRSRAATRARLQRSDGTGDRGIPGAFALRIADGRRRNRCPSTRR